MKKKSLVPPLILFGIVWILTETLNWFGINISQFSVWVVVVLLFLYYPLMFTCLALFNKFQGFKFKSLGFYRVKKTSRLVFVGICLGLTGSLSLFLLFHLFQWAGIIPEFSLSLSLDVPSYVLLAWFWVSVLIMLGAAAVEEGIFRGYIQRVFRLRMNAHRSLFLASSLFAIAHFSVMMTIKSFQTTPQMFQSTVLVSLINVFGAIFPLGIFLGYTYFKTKGNLICPVVFHATHNLSVLWIQYLTNSYMGLTFLTAPAWSIVILILWIIITGKVVLKLERFMKTSR